MQAKERRQHFAGKPGFGLDTPGSIRAGGIQSNPHLLAASHVLSSHFGPLARPHPFGGRGRRHMSGDVSETLARFATLEPSTVPLARWPRLRFTRQSLAAAAISFLSQDSAGGPERSRIAACVGNALPLAADELFTTAHLKDISSHHNPLPTLS